MASSILIGSTDRKSVVSDLFIDCFCSIMKITIPNNPYSPTTTHTHSHPRIYTDMAMRYEKKFFFVQVHNSYRSWSVQDKHWRSRRCPSNHVHHVWGQHTVRGCKECPDHEKSLVPTERQQQHANVVCQPLLRRKRHLVILIGC